MATSKPRHLRNWFLAAILAALTAVLVQTLTGALTSVSSKIWAFLTRQEPIEATVALDPVSFARSHDLMYVIPRPIDQIPPAPRYGVDGWGKFDQWATGIGAIDAEITEVHVTVTGRTATPVILTNLRVRVVARRPPASGIYVRRFGAGALPLRYLLFDLDSSPPKEEAGDDYGGTHPVTFPYKVSATEPEVFLIAAMTKACDCSWVAELFWTAGGKKGSTQINDRGKPFRTTSLQNAPQTYYFGERGLFPKD